MNWNVNNGLCNNVAEKLYMERSKVRLKTKKNCINSYKYSFFK